MKGTAVNQIEDIVTFRIEEDYQFSDGEEVKIKCIKNTFLDELRGLFWELLTWVIKSKALNMLPPGDKRWFRLDIDPFDLALEKLYTLLRWRVGFIEISYKSDGMKTWIPKSTSNEKITQKELSDLYEKVFGYLAQYIDMTEFNKQHQKARERMEKDY